MIRAAITGVAGYLPENIVTNFDLEKIIDILKQYNDSETIEIFRRKYYREKFKDFFYESLQNCNPKHRMRFMKP